MSTSLDKDLHSVYIDGELPEDFVSRYEEELSHDEKAKTELEKMRSIHNLLHEDADSKTVDKNFADASFERLMTKMSYAKTVHAAEKPSYIVPFTKYAASFAAAAAAFVVAFIPVYNNGISKAKSSENQVAAIEIKNDSEIKPISEKQIVVDGNLQRADLSSGIALASLKEENANQKKSSETQENADSITDNSVNNVEQKVIRASAMVSGGNSARQFSLPSFDPFKPDFSESQMPRFSLPKFEEISDNFEQ